MQDFDRFLLSVVYDLSSLIFVVDPVDGRIVYANRYMLETLGADCLERSFGEQFAGAGAAHYFVAYRGKLADDARETAPLEQLSEYYDDETENWYQVQQREISWIDGTPKIVCVLYEVNALKRLQKDLAEAHAALAFKNRELEISAKFDRLTNLYNRHQLDRVMLSEHLRFRRYGKCYSVLIADCDHFKQVNDNFGHQAGDTVLVEIAGIFAALIRATDTVGRWGGEEFMFVLPETALADAVRLADKLRVAIEQHDIPSVGQRTISVGVAEVRESDDIKDVIARADKALYAAKEGGRNRVVANT